MHAEESPNTVLDKNSLSHAPADPEFERYTRSIRTKTLRNLLLIWHNVLRDYETSPIANNIINRARQKEPWVEFTIRNLVWSLGADDIAKMLKISKRQAIDYVKVFRIIYSGIT